MAAVIRVGLDPKKTVQWQKSKDLTTGIVTISATQYWIVAFDSAQSDPSQCYGAIDPNTAQKLPNIGDKYPGTSGLYAPQAYVINPQLDPASAGKVYRVTVQFQGVTQNGTSGKWDTQVSFDGEPIQVTAFFDLDQNPIVNSAGQNFASQPTETFYDGKLSISFKTTTFDETTCEGLRGCSNSGAITLTISALGYSRTFDTDTLRLDDYSAQPVVQLGSLAYWQVSLHFTQRNKITAPHGALSGMQSAFMLFLVDQGYCEKGTPPVPIKDSKGNLLNTPHYLDGSGNKTDTAYFLNFTLTQSSDLSPLFTGIS